MQNASKASRIEIRPEEPLVVEAYLHPVMRIEIQREESSYPIVYENVINAYTKGLLYCVLFERNGKRVIHKFPIASLFRMVEDYDGGKR